MPKIEIDGKEIECKPGAMIIEVADAENIYIPRFCYHKKLSIAANCRMCLVEVEKAPKPMPACATPITDGMKIFTKSPKAVDAQKAVMEFLLINHPLDCPICDQGGECELQDLSMGFGNDNSNYTETKRSVHDEDLGALISTDMTRCIHCTRCVRFGQEIAGFRELGATSRGEEMQITTYIQKTLASEISANIIDLCPVGALTSKPYRFRARAWELKEYASVSPHDCVGSHLYVHTRRDIVLRVVPKDNEAINESWISDRDRFSYLGCYQDRITKPMIKKNGKWQECDWPHAFDFVLTNLQTIIHEQNAEEIAAIASPSSTIEELFLLQKFMRSIGSNHIDHRTHQTDFKDDEYRGLYPHCEIKISKIEEQRRILLIGSNIQREQPLLAHRIRKATLKGTKVVAINPVNYPYYFETAEKETINPNRFALFLSEVLLALVELTKESLPNRINEKLHGIEPSDYAKKCAHEFLQGETKLILTGAFVDNHHNAATLRELIRWIAKISNAKIGNLTEGSNAAGAWIAGALPHRITGGKSSDKKGYNISQMFNHPRKAYILYNVEPECDFANPALVAKALDAANFVVAISPFQSEQMMKYADVILPIVPFTETSGTYVNVEGLWQSFSATTTPRGNARPGWKVLRVLGNFFKLDGFDYITSEQVRDEIHMILNNANQYSESMSEEIHLDSHHDGITRITEWPLYRVDNIVRRSEALQKSHANESLTVRLNKSTAAKLNLLPDESVWIKQNQGQIKLPWKLDEKIPDDCVWVPAGFYETACLADSFSTIEVSHAL